MKHVFIDDSIHKRGDFIISGVVLCDIDPNELIGQILTDCGFNPDESEFKSGLDFRRNPEMKTVRSKLKSVLSSKCKLGLVVLPYDKREKIGEETLKGLKQFIETNKIEDELNIYIDENYFKNVSEAEITAEKYNFENCKFHFEQDSKKVRGIQLADIVAHTFSIMLLETLGVIDKTVKAGENSGYDPDMDIEIGFEMWASIRYNFLCQSKENPKDDFDMAVYDVKPYGLYISEYCKPELEEGADKRFGEVYLGCIH